MGCLNNDYFTENCDKIVYDKINDFIIKYNSLPTKEALKIELSEAKITEEDFKSLLAIKDHIVNLKLPQCELNNATASQLKNFKNLVHLDLKDNPVEDQAISTLLVLENLEVLNLVGTKITDESFLAFQNFKNLKRVYVWQTSIQKTFIEEFNKKQDKVELIGATF